jgi:hypothetical protein
LAVPPQGECVNDATALSTRQTLRFHERPHQQTDAQYDRRIGQIEWWPSADGDEIYKRSAPQSIGDVAGGAAQGGADASRIQGAFGDDSSF